MPRQDQPLCAACDGCPVCAVNPDCCTDCTGDVDDEGGTLVCECEGHACGPAPDDIDMPPRGIAGYGTALARLEAALLEGGTA